MKIQVPDWREHEKSIDEVIEQYPDVPQTVILKIDLHRRGYILSEAARKVLDPQVHHTFGVHLEGETDATTVEGLYLRDGTSVCSGCVRDDEVVLRDPYLVDVEDGKLVIRDRGKTYEEATFWYRPDFYDHVTSKGTPMWQVVNARGTRLDANLDSYCQFWDTPGGGCKFCGIGVYGKQEKNAGHCLRLDPDDIRETLQEAVKQKGRFTGFVSTQGSILKGKELLDEELETYLACFTRVKDIFDTENIKAYASTTAMNPRQLERLKTEGGLQYYNADIEVLDRELFGWICAGKDRLIGYDNWKQRLYDAVDIFGRGHVSTNIVGGVELAKPYGFKTEEEALRADLREAEELAKHGVVVVDFVWRLSRFSVFRNQVTPSLEFYVRLAKGLADIHEAHRLAVYIADYSRSGNQPSGDLARIQKW